MSTDRVANLDTVRLMRLKETCAYIRSPDGSTGSGYLVAPGRIGTAEHVVRSWTDGQMVEVAIGTGPTRRNCRARVLRRDKIHDAAVLEIVDAFDVQPLPVANQLDQKAAWSGYGFPAVAGQSQAADGLPIDGHVQDPSTTNDLGQASVLLYSDIIAAGNASPLHGFSGSPVVVDGALVGHLTKHIGDVDDRRRAVFGYVYACPISAVLALLGDDVHPLRLDIEPAPIVTVSDVIPKLAADEYHVFVSYRSTDGPWAMSLVARLEGAGLKVFIDQQELQVGEALAGQLESALQRSRAAVVLVSQGWLASPWCQEEASVLKKRAVEDQQFRLVPLRLDDSPMPAFLDARVWLDFKGSQRAEGANLERLLNALIARKPQREDSASAVAQTNERKVTDEFVARVRVAAVSSSRQVEKVLAEWRQTASSDAAPQIAAAEALVGRGEFERALLVLDGAPPMLRVRQLRAFALRKQGQIDVAIELFEALQREGNLDAESSGLLAGSYKARWLKTGGLAVRQRAYELYSAAFERSGDPFVGINAAAMALYCGDQSKMHQYAGKVVEALRERPMDKLDHWNLATLGEGFMLNGRFDDARAWYARAAAKAAGLHQDIAVMRRQARQNLTALNRPRNQFDDVLPVPRVLAYFGHMVDAPGRNPPRFPASKVGAVRLAIRSRIEQFGMLHGFGCAARGTDLLFLDELAKRELTATVVLPFPEAGFLVTSVGGNWDTLFANLRDKLGIEFCPPLLDAQPPEDGLQTAFAKANTEVLTRAIEYARRLDETPLIVAVWDRAAGDGPGGTAEAVELWQMEGFEVDVIDITQL